MSDVTNDNDGKADQDQDCGCTDASCCSTDLSAETSGLKKVRTVLFAVIVLAAISVAAYSMLSGSGEAEANPPASDTMHAAAAPASEGFGGAQSGESEFTFIVLGSGGERDAGVAFAAESARQKLTAQGTPAKMRSLMPDDSEFAATVAKHAVTSFPAVIAISGDGAAALIEGEIDETRLLKAYLASCASASGCGDATGAGCPPGACGK